MQTVTLKIKLLPPNKGKLEKMTRMLEIYRQACSWFLDGAGRSFEYYQPGTFKP